jgi:heptosyltransferase-2
MAWRRTALEAYVALAGICTGTEEQPPENPESIFVLRNNDIGDLLVVTPLFEALRRRFPRARIVAGIGDWNRPVLEGNPYISDVLAVNAPWHNQQIHKQDPLSALLYIWSSPEARMLESQRFGVGIDVLGSGYGSLLLMRARMPFRLGVRGYAGGHSAASMTIPFSPDEHVGRMALRFAEVLGTTTLPEVRPQLFLRENEHENCDVVVAPGGRYIEKRWPLDSYRKLLQGLRHRRIALLAGPSDQPLCAQLAEGLTHVQNLGGRLTLRQSLRCIAGSRLVICNSSMAMHAAAAFRKPCLVLLGEGISDARQHARQWAYPETMVLGKTIARSTIYSPDEVLGSDWSLAKHHES